VGGCPQAGRPVGRGARRVSAARRLVLVRHGLSVWNVEQRIQGQTCAGLTEHGRLQAERTAEAIASRWAGAVVVASDLERCRDTAAPIAAALGVEVHHDPVLRERDFGAWEGFTREDLEREDPVRYERWKAGEDLLDEVGGETDVVLRSRAATAFAALLDGEGAGSITGDELDSDTIVAVTHGGTIWHGLHALLGLAPVSLGGVDNASVSELVRLGGRASVGSSDRPRSTVLSRFNEGSHLP
jgi:broad specificity phosphatase PhoE